MATDPEPVILTGSTDTRGHVTGAEHEHLAKGFGYALRFMREESGMTLQQVGELAGVGCPHLSRLERGERRPSVDLIKAVARVFAPEGPLRDALESRLAGLAGDSLREGAQRKKRRENAKARRQGRALFLQQVRKTRKHIAQLEAAGRPVPEVLRKLADSEVVDRIAGPEPKPEPGIPNAPGFKTPQERLADAKQMQRKSLTELAKLLRGG